MGLWELGIKKFLVSSWLIWYQTLESPTLLHNKVPFLVFRHRFLKKCAFLSHQGMSKGHGAHEIGKSHQGVFMNGLLRSVHYKCTDMECLDMSHKGMCKQMFKYGVFRYVPSRSVQINVPVWSVDKCPIVECLNIGPSKECLSIKVPLRNIHLLRKKKNTACPGNRTQDPMHHSSWPYHWANMFH